MTVARLRRSLASLGSASSNRPDITCPSAIDVHGRRHDLHAKTQPTTARMSPGLPIMAKTTSEAAFTTAGLVSGGLTR